MTLVRVKNHTYEVKQTIDDIISLINKEIILFINKEIKNEN